MSQSSTLGGDRSGDAAKAASTGRAVLVLAIAVILGVVILQQLDKSPVVSTSTANATQTTSQAAPVAPPNASGAPVTGVLPRSPADVKVLVANGIGVTGIASKVAGRLQPVGYQLLKPGNTVRPETNSLVQYTPGYAAEAQAVATSLGMPASAVQAMPIPSPVTDLQGAHVMVIVGNELANAPQTQSAQPQTGTNAQTSTGQAQSGTTATTINPALNGPLTSGAINSTPAGGTTSN